MTTSQQIKQFRKGVSATIADTNPISSPEIEALRKANAELKQQVANTQKELDQTLALQAARKIQSQHDRAEAIAHKMQSNDKTGISIVRNGLSQTDLVEVQMLAVLNNERERKGQKPFRDYTEYLNSFIDTPAPTPVGKISIVPTTKLDPVTPLEQLAELSLDYEGRPLKAGGEVWQIVSGKYFIGWNKSRCYVQRTETNEVNILVSGDALYGDMSLMSIIPNNSFRDLTRAEVDGIIKGKPAYKDLFLAFSKFRNCQNVYLDLKNAVQVW